MLKVMSLMKRRADMSFADFRAGRRRIIRSLPRSSRACAATA